MPHKYAALGDTLYFHFAGNDTSGSGADGATPAAHVRLCGAAADAAPVLSPTPSLLSHATYPAGAHEVAVEATEGNGFAAAGRYAVFCTLAVDSQNPTGFVGSFTLTSITSMVWDALTSALTTAGSVGKLLYERISLIGTGGATVSAPVSNAEDLEIIIGDDYYNADSRACEWSVGDANWPSDLTDAAIALSYEDRDGSGGSIGTGSVITATGDSRKVRVELTATETATLSPSIQYRYKVKATLDSGHKVTLARGDMTAVDNVGE